MVIKERNVELSEGKVKKNILNKQIFLEIFVNKFFAALARSHTRHYIIRTRTRNYYARARAFNNIAYPLFGHIFIQGYRKVTISLRHVANTRAVKPLRFLALAQGRFARIANLLWQSAKSLNSNIMTSKQIEQILSRAKASISNAYWTLDIAVDELNELGMREKSSEVWQIESILSALEQQIEAIKQRYNELPF